MDEASKADNLSGEKFLAGASDTICETDNISLFVMGQVTDGPRLTTVRDSAGTAARICMSMCWEYEPRSEN